MDGAPRKQDAHVDIGAYETAGCPWYRIRLVADEREVEIETTVTFRATVYDAFDGVVADCPMTFAVVEGQVTQSPPGSTTGPNGESATAQVSSTVEGWVVLRADMVEPCSETTISATAAVYFYDPVTADPDADWPMFQHDIAHTGVTPTALSTDVELQWSIPLIGTATSDVLWSSPIVRRGLVYVGTDAGWFYAARADTGDSVGQVNLWSPIHGTPCAYDGRVYVATEDGVIHGLNSWTLEEEWTFDTEQRITGSPVACDGVVYVGTCRSDGQGELRSIPISEGVELCANPYDRETQYNLDYATPAVFADCPYTGGGRAYVSDVSCYVTAFRCSDGIRVWEHQEDWYAMHSSPAIYVARGQGQSQHQIFVGSDDNCVYRLTDDDSASGAWKRFDTGYEVYSTPAVTAQAVFFGSQDQYVYRVDRSAFDEPTPQEDWKTSLGSPITSSPVLSGGVLFIATDDAKLRGLDTADGSVDWQADLANATTRSSPAAAEGRLYVVGGTWNERRLYCFGLSD